MLRTGRRSKCEMSCEMTPTLPACAKLLAGTSVHESGWLKRRIGAMLSPRGASQDSLPSQLTGNDKRLTQSVYL